jgi:hypothetical protein
MNHQKILLTILFVLAFFKGQAQINLVRNGSFEDTVQCPIAVDHIKATRHWTGIDSNITIYDSFASYAMPDLMHSCATVPSLRLPLNTWFLRYPRTGNAMVTVLMYNDNRDSTWLFYQRDYLQGRLRNRLVSGRQYCVTFYTTITQASTYAIDHIGAYFDDGTIDTIAPERCPLVHSMFHPQIYDTVISNDTMNWTKIEGTFTASGTEKFITIGNFFTSDQVDTVQVYYPSLYSSSGYRLFSYYLIDDVSVIATDAVADAGRDTTITLAATDSAFVGVQADYVPCKWYTMAGTLIDSNIGGFKVKPTATTSYIMELDVCGPITRDTVTVRVLPMELTSPRPALRGREVACWPNPVGDELTITGAKDCVVELVDVVGRTVITSTPTTEKTLIDVSKLPPGTYFVKVTEPVTGGCVTKRLVKD